GLPVISCKTRGVPDVVIDQKTGVLAREGDLPQFASLIRNLLDDRALRQKLGQNAKAFVSEERSLANAASLLKFHFQDALG
ncbi:MAG: glycosyltransferase, partial [Sneathiella sp.]